MPRTSQGPPCPKPARVREMIELVGTLEDVPALLEHDLIDALDWLATMLENRSLYHKRQQKKTQIIKQLAKEYGLDDQANVLTRDSMHELVSNSEPDLDLSELKNLQGDDKDD